MDSIKRLENAGKEKETYENMIKLKPNEKDKYQKLIDNMTIYDSNGDLCLSNGEEETYKHPIIKYTYNKKREIIGQTIEQ